MDKYRKRAFKLQFIGSKRSKAAYIALPAAWVRAHELKQGDKLVVYYLPDADEIVVLPATCDPIDEVAFVRRKQ